MPSPDSPELFPRDAPSTREAASPDPQAPLADRMRPGSLAEIVGQDHLLAEGRALRTLIESGRPPSLLFWGPPGTGKTTMARLVAGAAKHRLESLSAVLAGVKEIRAAIERARETRRAGVATILLLDEIHRLNRAQQDVLLPHVEAGTVTLIGATTENPSFEVNAPLLSRCRVFTLNPLDEASLATVIERAAADSARGLGGQAIDAEAVGAIASAAHGDARRALGLLEASAAVCARAGGNGQPITAQHVVEAAGTRVLLYDRDREEHFNTISALIKCLRASDPDAAIYYLTRMLAAGEDPLYLARRMIVFAAEDVGTADPQALTVAVGASQAVERIGMPEGRIPLAQAALYLACADKSRAAYEALCEAEAAVNATGAPPVPLHLRNAPTPLMKELGYGRRDPAAAAPENLPEALAGSRFYVPPAERDRTRDSEPGD